MDILTAGFGMNEKTAVQAEHGMADFSMAEARAALARAETVLLYHGSMIPDGQPVRLRNG